MQKLYDDANGRLQMHIVRKATREEVLASEGLVVNRTNKHANIQRGGGPLRGLSEDELIRRAGLGARNGKLQIWRPTSNSVSPQQMALIVAAGIAIAGGCYYGYQRYKKVKRLRASSAATSALTGSTGQPLVDNSVSQTEVEAGKARVNALKRAAAASSRSFSTAPTNQPPLDDAARQAEFEARKARMDAIKKRSRTSTRGFLGTVAAYAALVLAAEALKQE